MIKIKRGAVISFVIVAVILVSALFIAEKNPTFKGYTNDFKNKLADKTLTKDFAVKIKSGNLSTDYTIEETLSDIEKFQLNTVNVPVIINIDNLSSNDAKVNQESKLKAIRLIKKLQGKKINIILEPYPWIKDGELYETDWAPTDTDMFFNNWKTKVLQTLIKDIAVPYHVDALNVASNFIHMEDSQDQWCDVIGYVRSMYKGLITYRTSWWYTAAWSPTTEKAYEEKLNNVLFSKVDFISVAAYFELTNKDTNTVDNLVQAIQSTQIYDRKQNVKQELKNFYDKWHKPIFFGELGFPKRSFASMQPWNPIVSDVENGVEQANCFEAYKLVFENEPWQLGFSIFAIGQHGKDKNYYPGDKSTEVLRNWYVNH